MLKQVEEPRAVLARTGYEMAIEWGGRKPLKGGICKNNKLILNYACNFSGNQYNNYCCLVDNN
ncbi:hypothetical protein HMPREF0494_1132 [Limosilactobacillus antri DSM 16041]|uniref:Uncharacterized protein n=1 Tax=Limosilactobacillus antri DSM 16041 TaxID=525309 RepID=C8P738_9LACO|nr:hypothetical protein HMPREF0494_1132 [Limosilactobacillus antri DSM 16041]KRK60079.1 hypothetical protein FC31_GL002021 [Limosilactobacillus antri DSM 16041]